MGPLIGSQLIGLGGNLFSGLASWLGGGQGRKRQNQMWNTGQQMFNDNAPILDPNQMVQNGRMSRQPMLAQMGRGIDRKFGLDSGVGAGQLADRQLAGDSQTYNDAYSQNAQMIAQRKMQLFQALAQMAGQQ